MTLTTVQVEPRANPLSDFQGRDIFLQTRLFRFTSTRVLFPKPALDKWLCQNGRGSRRKRAKSSNGEGDVGDVKREDLWHPEKGYLFHATAGLLLEFSNKSNETGEM